MYSHVLERRAIESAFYPERSQPDGFNLDRWIYENLGYFLLPLKTRLRPYWVFVERVNSVESEYTDLSDDQLRDAVIAVAGSKRLKDREDAIARIFAGVRIAAQLNGPVQQLHMTVRDGEAESGAPEAAGDAGVRLWRWGSQHCGRGRRVGRRPAAGRSRHAGEDRNPRDLPHDDDARIRSRRPGHCPCCRRSGRDPRGGR